MDLDSLLASALSQQSRRSSKRKPRISEEAEDYANRLAEKALYRRLITETNIAQDGIRFIFWFGRQPEFSLDEWRRLIDREMTRARSHSSVLNHSNNRLVNGQEGDRESQMETRTSDQG